VDVFDREAHFIEEILKPLVDHFPELKIVSEHITTKQVGVYFLMLSQPTVFSPSSLSLAHYCYLGFNISVLFFYCTVIFHVAYSSIQQ
jgi:dihydroorotase